MSKESKDLVPFFFPETLETERLIFRRHSEGLAPEMFHEIEKNRERLLEYIPWATRTRTLKDLKAWILGTIDSWKEKTLFDYSLFLKSDDTYIGHLGLHSIAWLHARAELGYWISSSFEGNGYIHEAIGGLEKIAFDHGFHRLEIRCDPRNTRSAKVAEKAGYRREAQLREDIVINGIRRDSLIFGKLQAEFVQASRRR